MHFTYEKDDSLMQINCTYGIETIHIWNIYFIREIACEIFVREGYTHKTEKVSQVDALKDISQAGL